MVHHSRSPSESTVLVRFDCGCVGSVPTMAGASLLVDCCDSTDDEPHLTVRDMSGKDFVLCDETRQHELLLELRQALQRGAAFERLRDSVVQLLRPSSP